MHITFNFKTQHFVGENYMWVTRDSISVSMSALSNILRTFFVKAFAFLLAKNNGPALCEFLKTQLAEAREDLRSQVSAAMLALKATTDADRREIFNDIIKDTNRDIGIADMWHVKIVNNSDCEIEVVIW